MARRSDGGSLPEPGDGPAPAPEDQPVAPPAAVYGWIVANDHPTDTVRAYDVQARRLAEEYERLDPTAYRSAFAEALPPGAGRLALDVGAGSGRDAAWLAGLGYDVVAAEPANGMRAEGERRHGDVGIRWLDDRLSTTDDGAKLRPAL